MQAAAGRRAELASAGARVDGGVEYSYSVFANGADLLGQTVSGTIEIRGFALDTTLLSDGWHILSYHAHSIDHRMVPGFTGNQLASEVKIPICIDNQGEGACPPAR